MWPGSPNIHAVDERLYYYNYRSKPHTTSDNVPYDDVQVQPGRCPSPVILRGQCVEHKVEHLLFIRCKRRDCPICGPWISQRHAKRMLLGMRHFLAKGQRVGFFVGTFNHDISPDDMNVVIKKFIHYQRKRLRHLGRLEYARGDEYQKSGRLHVNLLLTPWEYQPHAELIRIWEDIVYRVTGVRGSDNVRISDATKAAKGQTVEQLAAYVASASPEKLEFDLARVANYIAKNANEASSNVGTKLHQRITTRGKRGVAFSRGWPKLPDETGEWARKGKITWSFLDSTTHRQRLNKDVYYGRWVPYFEGQSCIEYIAAPDVFTMGVNHCHCYELERADQVVTPESAEGYAEMVSLARDGPRPYYLHYKPRRAKYAEAFRYLTWDWEDLRSRQALSPLNSVAVGGGSAR